MIKKYLEPLIEDKKTKEKLEIELRELRNKCATGFFLLNGVFVTMLVVLQSHTDSLGISWLPWTCPSDVTVEPLGFAFLIMFGAVLLIQTLGMIAHRLGTFQHLMSTTDVTCGGHKKADSDEILKLARTLGRLADDDQPSDNDDNDRVSQTERTNTDDDSNSDNDDTYEKKPTNRSRRSTTTAISRRSTTVVPNGDANFNRRFASIKENPTEENIAAVTGIRAPPRGILKRRRTTTSIRYIKEAGIIPPNPKTDERDASKTRRSGHSGFSSSNLSGGWRKQKSVSEFDNPGFASEDAATCGFHAQDAADGTRFNVNGNADSSSSQHHTNVSASGVPRRPTASVRFKDDVPPRNSVDAEVEVHRCQTDADDDNDNELINDESQPSVNVARSRHAGRQPIDAMTERLQQQGFHVSDEVGKSQGTSHSRYEIYQVVEQDRTASGESNGRKGLAFSKYNYGGCVDE